MRIPGKKALLNQSLRFTTERSVIFDVMLNYVFFLLTEKNNLKVMT